MENRWMVTLCIMLSSQVWCYKAGWREQQSLHVTIGIHATFILPGVSAMPSIICCVCKLGMAFLVGCRVVWDFCNFLLDKYKCKFS